MRGKGKGKGGGAWGGRKKKEKEKYIIDFMTKCLSPELNLHTLPSLLVMGEKI
jgi:hypothetical protein